MGLSHTVGQTIVYHGKSDIGMVRDENQDAFRIVAPETPEQARNKGLLLVLADGMGGLAYGAKASQLAVEIIADGYYGKEGPSAELLLKAAHDANQGIFDETHTLPGNQPMGSTMTALALLEGRGLIAHVGDSRAYRFSEASGIQQMTRDHTLVQELAERGEIEPDSLPYLLHRNVLTRGLGLQEEVEIDLIEIPRTEPGETFLLCSDGLYDVIADAEIESRMVAHGAAQADLVEDLIELGRSRGAPDNITILVARIEANEESAEGPRRRVFGRSGVETVDAEETDENARALGFVPRSIFTPIAYFLAFAFGCFLTLHLDSASQRAEQLGDAVNRILGSASLREYVEGSNDALKEELNRFAIWMGQEPRVEDTADE